MFNWLLPKGSALSSSYNTFIVPLILSVDYITVHLITFVKAIVRKLFKNQMDNTKEVMADMWKKRAPVH